MALPSLCQTKHTRLTAKHVAIFLGFVLCSSTIAFETTPKLTTVTAPHRGHQLNHFTLYCVQHTVGSLQQERGKRGARSPVLPMSPSIGYMLQLKKKRIKHHQRPTFVVNYVLKNKMHLPEKSEQPVQHFAKIKWQGYKWYLKYIYHRKLGTVTGNCIVVFMFGSNIPHLAKSRTRIRRKSGNCQPDGLFCSATHW